MENTFQGGRRCFEWGWGEEKRSAKKRLLRERGDFFVCFALLAAEVAFWKRGPQKSIFLTTVSVYTTHVCAASSFPAPFNQKLGGGDDESMSRRTKDNAVVGTWSRQWCCCFYCFCCLCGNLASRSSSIQ